MSAKAFWHTRMQARPDFTTPAALTTIETEAFSGTAAAYVYLSDGVRSVAGAAFASCPRLAYVRVPVGCTDIALDAFPAGVTLLTTSNDVANILYSLVYEHVMVGQSGYDE